MATTRPRFHELLRATREKANQSPGVVAILLNLDEETYNAIERGEKYPDTETLKRLCMMLEWNFYDTQRMIINEMSTPPTRTAPGDGEDALQALQAMPLEGGPSADDTARPTLGARMREVREQTGQSEDVIAMLLGLDVEGYRRLEAGDMPSDDLLRRISVVYDWNFYDLVAMLRSQHARTLQPRRVGSPFPGASSLQHRLRQVLAEVERSFARLPRAEQDYVLAQLELVQETARRRSAPPSPAAGSSA